MKTNRSQNQFLQRASLRWLSHRRRVVSHVADRAMMGFCLAICLLASLKSFSQNAQSLDDQATDALPTVNRPKLPLPSEGEDQAGLEKQSLGDIASKKDQSSGLFDQLAAIQTNNEGVELLLEERTTAAYKKFVEGLSEQPFSPPIRLNLALSFEVNEEVDKAINEYRAVRDLTDHPGAQFFSFYNEARLLASQKKIDEALAKYQAALEFKPDSLQTKHNIELLIQNQGGGGGKGDQQDKKKDKDGEGDKDEQPKDDAPRVNRRKQKPKPFESKELTKKDVERILDEIKNQEQKVRANVNKKSAKEKPRAKDW